MLQTNLGSGFIKVKVNKSASNRNWVSQKARQAGAYLQFLLYEATGSIPTPLGWDTSPSQVTSQHFVRLSASNLLVSIYTLGWREALRELSVLPKNKTWVHRPGLKISTF